jgi:MFS superfamily sulfate permease-like transporter
MLKNTFLKEKKYGFFSLSDDLLAGLVVFLVALPLCLGVALASGAPLFSGILSGEVTLFQSADSSTVPLSLPTIDV